MDKQKYLMTINTERLFIEPLSEKDASFMFELLNTDGWIKYIGNRNINSETEALAYIKDVNEKNKKTSSDIWTVRLKETNIAIGIITFIERDYLDFNDIGFAFLPTFSNKGYAYEATKSILENLAVETVFAITLPENKPSIKLIEKLGLKFEKIIEQDDEKLHLYGASKIWK